MLMSGAAEDALAGAFRFSGGRAPLLGPGSLAGEC